VIEDEGFNNPKQEEVDVWRRLGTKEG